MAQIKSPPPSAMASTDQHTPQSSRTAQDVPGQDFILSFQIKAAMARGRFARLGPALERLMAHHDYPDCVAELLAQALVLASLLAGALKFKGIFTLQTKGDGPVTMVVADVTSLGALRGCVHYDKEALATLLARTVQPNFQELVGEGYVAFTVDQGPDTDRYQGIVALKESFLESLVHYFQQSEQLETGLVAVAKRHPIEGWQAGAMFVQKMPITGGHDEAGRPLTPKLPASDEEDGWRHAMVVMATVEEEELLAPDLSPLKLLYQLFHDLSPTASDWLGLYEACRCQREKILGVLHSLPVAEQTALLLDGPIVVNCEFCNTDYHFTAADFEPIEG
jgi:molecular chaperone Hsp33